MVPNEPDAEWFPIDSAPKSPSCHEPIEILGWIPSDGPRGGDRRVIWWISNKYGIEGCWWGDRDIEEFPTLWTWLPKTPKGE